MSASAAPTAAPVTGPSAAQRPGTVLRYDIVFRPTDQNYVDLGTPGPGVGDLLVFQDRILDRRGRQVGVEGGSCTITALLPGGHFQTHCVGTVSRLPAGRDRGSRAWSPTCPRSGWRSSAGPGATGPRPAS